MPTAWTYPSTVVQFCESGAEQVDIAWDDSKSFVELKDFDGRLLPSIGTLYHISRSPKPDIKNKTWFLRLTNFNFQNLPANLSGIEVKIDARRYGRAQDETVQLCLNGNYIGDNFASPDIAPQKLYGNQTELWNSGIDVTAVNNSTFGVTIRFQAHKSWPHRDPILLDSVQIRIW